MLMDQHGHVAYSEAKQLMGGCPTQEMKLHNTVQVSTRADCHCGIRTRMEILLEGKSKLSNLKQDYASIRTP